MHRRWLSFPLLSSYVTAFYPYHEGGTTPKRHISHSHPEQRLDAGIVTLDIKRVERRNNVFPVVLANPATAQNALAINQDGDDFSYFATMKFGSKGQGMYMLIDTGSANTWVMGSDCASKACSIHNTFGSPDSATLNTTTQKWDLAYGTGEVSGVVASDTVAFASYTLNMSFGLANTVSDDFNNYPMDGILGLGRPASNSLGTPTILEVLDKETKLQNNIVGIHLNRDSDGTNDGQIMFGGVDTSKFSGQISYVPTTSLQTWQIAVSDAMVNGKGCNFTGKNAIVDTGTTYLLLPPADAQALHSQIPGSVRNGEIFSVPCATTAKVEFVFSGKSYSISPKDYVTQGSGTMCNSNIIGHQAFGINDWILGDVFLKNVYAVFDFDQNRIGFGTPGSGGSTVSAIIATTSTLISSQSMTMTTSTSTSTSTTSKSSNSSGSSTVASTRSPSSTSADSSPIGGDGTSSKSAAIRQTYNLGAAMLIAFILGLLL